VKKISDLELVRLLKAGNKKAFNELYERYWEIAYDIAYKQLHDEDNAKDIVHDVFIHIWTKQEQLGIDKSFIAYLYTCLKNRIIDNVRKENFRARQLDRLRQTLSEEDHSMMDDLLSRELEDQILLKVNSLPDKMKEVYRLSREEELSIDEIAEKLSLSPQTVKNQISNALKRLRSSIHFFISFL